VSTPAKVSTYAYVNPIVAVFLGWAFAGEAITARTLIAAAVILAGVAIITMAGSAGESGARSVVRGARRPEEESDVADTPRARRRKIASG
jgi:hypothetical protein